MRSPVSWAKVTRELVRALAETGAHVSAVSLKGYLYDADFPLDPEVETAIARRRREGWDLALDYPPNFARLSAGSRAGIIIYEADSLPAHWVGPIREHLDLAVVPSEFSLEAAAASGIPRDMLAVAPFGVNPQIYRPEGPAAAPATDRAFNFLAVAAPHVRKGLAELTEAFTNAFEADDDVGLVIKCPPLAGLGKRAWEYKSVADFMPEGRGRQIALVEGVLSEEGMAALYRAGDVCVQPSYGESFGLAPLEALSCGTPVVATGWGGVLEFLDDSNSWLVDYDLVEAGEFAYDWRGEGGLRMARPRVESLGARLREAFEDADARSAKAAAGLETAAAFTWRRSAEVILSRLADFAAGPNS